MPEVPGLAGDQGCLATGKSPMLLHVWLKLRRTCHAAASGIIGDLPLVGSLLRQIPCSLASVEPPFLSFSISEHTLSTHSLVITPALPPLESQASATGTTISIHTEPPPAAMYTSQRTTVSSAEETSASDSLAIPSETNTSQSYELSTSTFAAPAATSTATTESSDEPLKAWVALPIVMSISLVCLLAGALLLYRRRRRQHSRADAIQHSLFFAPQDNGTSEHCT